MSKPRYATVPITLLKNIHKDQGGTIRQMFDYAVYDRMRKNYPDCVHEDFQEPAMEESMEYFNLQPNRLSERMGLGKELYDTFHGTPNASVSINLLLDFQKEKTEFELMVFSFHCAIRSMIGTKPYLKTTDDYWLSRAFGYATVQDYQNVNLTQAEKDMRVKYSNRYWLDKIKNTLQNDWHLVYVSSNKYIKIRGFYVSTQMTYEQLVLIAKGKNEVFKSKQTARNDVLARVFG
jgi:hypothetical protein